MYATYRIRMGLHAFLYLTWIVLIILDLIFFSWSYYDIIICLDLLLLAAR